MTDAANTPATANVGVVGLAVMGANLARNLASREGNRVAVYNRSHDRTEQLLAAHPEAQLIGTETIAEFAATLAKPRTAIILVQAGSATDAVIDSLCEVFESGDIIIDGGNALYTDTIRREKAVAARGIHFVGAGISGGEEGALNGPSIMPGGPAESYRTVGPIFESIAASTADGTPCVTHIGADGSGHFVKMIHNGIEYADMQLIAEAYQLLRSVAGLTPAEISEVFKQWNSTELESYLVEITAEVLAQVDPATGKPLVDIIVDQAGQKGTGTWTVQAALSLGTPVSAIAEAVFARGLSSQPAQRIAAEPLRGGVSATAIADPAAKQSFIEDVRQALYASKIIAYSQGFDVIRDAAAAHGWQIDQGAVASIWRAGCIIRAAFLDRITDAFRNEPELQLLAATPFFAEALRGAEAAWRRVVTAAVNNAVPAPAFGAALAYYDGLRAERLPAALIQGQRDFFGAHTYGRVDRPGVFHTDWSGSRTETQLS